jgi:hypothetical protein
VFSSPTLVPLADLLTNTVGITIFIMIFTVLTAGGAVVAKRLPLERSTEAASTTFLCSGNRIWVMDENRWISDFEGPLGRPAGFYDVPAWIERFNERRLESDNFIVTGDGDTSYSTVGFGRSVSMSLVVVFTPKPDRGETVESLDSAQSAFRRFLSSSSPRSHFAYFIVRPDSLEIFDAARRVASSLGFESGWSPNTTEDGTVRFSLSGGGTAQRPQ